MLTTGSVGQRKTKAPGRETAWTYRRLSGMREGVRFVVRRQPGMDKAVGFIVAQLPGIHEGAVFVVPRSLGIDADFGFVHLRLPGLPEGVKFFLPRQPGNLGGFGINRSPAFLGRKIRAQQGWPIRKTEGRKAKTCLVCSGRLARHIQAKASPF
jgi:hypothetical protein